MVVLIHVHHTKGAETEMARAPSHGKAQTAWDRLMTLGGHGVWDGDMVIVSLADTWVTDDDLAVFRDFPFVQTLDLSRTEVSDAGLAHLAGLMALAELIVVNTRRATMNGPRCLPRRGEW